MAVVELSPAALVVLALVREGLVESMIGHVRKPLIIIRLKHSAIFIGRFLNRFLKRSLRGSEDGACRRLSLTTLRAKKALGFLLDAFPSNCHRGSSSSSFGARGF